MITIILFLPIKILTIFCWIGKNIFWCATEFWAFVHVCREMKKLTHVRKYRGSEGVLGFGVQ